MDDDGGGGGGDGGGSSPSVMSLLPVTKRVFYDPIYHGSSSSSSGAARARHIYQRSASSPSLPSSSSSSSSPSGGLRAPGGHRSCLQAYAAAADDFSIYEHLHVRDPKAMMMTTTTTTTTTMKMVEMEGGNAPDPSVPAAMAPRLPHLMRLRIPSCSRHGSASAEKSEPDPTGNTDDGLAASVSPQPEGFL